MRNTKLCYTTSWWASYSVCLSYLSPLQLQFRTLISGPKVVWAYNASVRWTQQHWPNATGGVGRDTLPRQQVFVSYIYLGLDLSSCCQVLLDPLVFFRGPSFLCSSYLLWWLEFGDGHRTDLRGYHAGSWYCSAAAIFSRNPNVTCSVVYYILILCHCFRCAVAASCYKFYTLCSLFQKSLVRGSSQPLSNPSVFNETHFCCIFQSLNGVFFLE